MQDQFALIARLQHDGVPFAVARVVSTLGSAPRPAGATMVVTEDGSASGSVSGGCVEGAVYEGCLESITTGEPSLEHYGFSDETAFAVGLTCGGTLDVFIQPSSTFDHVDWQRIHSAAEGAGPTALVTVTKHPDPDQVGQQIVLDSETVHGEMDGSWLTDATIDDARGLLAVGVTRTLHYVDAGRIGEASEVFVQSFVAPARFIVVGAVDFAAAVVQVASFLGHHVTVCDARPVFVTETRFPEADEIEVSWPHVYIQRELAAGRIDERTMVCVLTHDPKFDIPLLRLLLTLPPGTRPGYIGAMGSRRTHDERVRALSEAGITDAQLAQLRSPIGLHLGARTPEETAVSIVAEVIADRWHGTGKRLSEVAGPIHQNDLDTSAVTDREPA